MVDSLFGEKKIFFAYYHLQKKSLIMASRKTMLFQTHGPEVWCRFISLFISTEPVKYNVMHQMIQSLKLWYLGLGHQCVWSFPSTSNTLVQSWARSHHDKWQAIRRVRSGGQDSNWRTLLCTQWLSSWRLTHTLVVRV